jgi:hypothetical protein
MIGRMVWWESAAAPNRDEQRPECAANLVSPKA